MRGQITNMVPNNLDLVSDGSGQLSVGLEVILVEGILNADNGVLVGERLVELC